MISPRIYLFSQDSPSYDLFPSDPLPYSSIVAHTFLQEEEPIRPTSCDFPPHLNAASFESIPTPSLQDSIPQSSFP